MNTEDKYQVTARKWRPMEFASVVGQEHITQTLVNAIITGRLHHAYLFNGPRGVGKTTTARILAKALNCLEPSEIKEPCNVCESCKQILEGRSMDVVEIDGASNNSVDDIRKLRENAKYPPVTGNRKIYIIDEVHMLSTSAFNALLKTLEEPPKHLMFIFATTEPHKVPATILSRCQRFDFRRMQVSDIVGRLKFIASKEQITIDDDSLIIIARKADGSMRDSQSIFDQVVAFCGMNIEFNQVNSALSIIDQGFFFRVTDMMIKQDTQDAFNIVQDIMVSGYDPQEFLIGLSEHFRNYLTMMTTNNTKLIEAAKSYVERYAAEGSNFTKGDIIRALNKTLQAQQNIRFASQPRLRLELLLSELSTLDTTVKLEELLDVLKNIPPNYTTKQTLNEPSELINIEKKKSELTNDFININNTNGIDVIQNNDSPKDNIIFQSNNLIDNPLDSQQTTDKINTENSNDLIISIKFIQDNWSDFIKQLKDKPGMANQLQTLPPSELSGNSIVFFVENENEEMMLTRGISYLNERISDYFKVQLSVKFVRGKPPVELKDKNNKNGEIKNMSKAKIKNSDHPFLKALAKELGAVPI